MLPLKLTFLFALFIQLLKAQSSFQDTIEYFHNRIYLGASINSTGLANDLSTYKMLAPNSVYLAQIHEEMVSSNETYLSSEIGLSASYERTFNLRRNKKILPYWGAFGSLRSERYSRKLEATNSQYAVIDTLTGTEGNQYEFGQGVDDYYNATWNAWHLNLALALRLYLYRDESFTVLPFLGVGISQSVFSKSDLSVERRQSTYFLLDNTNYSGVWEDSEEIIQVPDSGLTKVILQLGVQLNHLEISYQQAYFVSNNMAFSPFSVEHFVSLTLFGGFGKRKDHFYESRKKKRISNRGQKHQS